MIKLKINTLWYSELITRGEDASAAKLARELGISQSALSGLRAGKTTMVQFETLCKLAARFGLNADTIGKLFDFGDDWKDCIFCGVNSAYPARTEAIPCCDDARSLRGEW